MLEINRFGLGKGKKSQILQSWSDSKIPKINFSVKAKNSVRIKKMNKQFLTGNNKCWNPKNMSARRSIL